MKDIDFVLKIIQSLPDTRQTDLYLLMQDKIMRRIDYPQPGEPFNPARCPLATRPTSWPPTNTKTS
jgi:hypothetical protein